MAVLTLTLSEGRQAFIDAEVASGRYASPNDMIAALVQAEELRKNQDAIDELLLEAENETEEPILDSPEFRESLRQEIEEFIRSDRA